MANEHVFLVTADGLRYDRLSQAGRPGETSPTLDALAADGAVCEQAIVTGTATRKSFPGILTSSYPLMYGGFAQLTEHRVPLSSVFRDAGYTTIGVNGNAQLHPRFGWDRGYDVFFDSESVTVNDPVGDFDQFETDEGAADGSDADGGERGGVGDRFDAAFENLKSTAYERLDQDGLLYSLLERAYRQVDERQPPHPRAPALVDRALEFVDHAPDDTPLFVWVHFMETHSPYVAPAEYRERYVPSDPSLGRIWGINDRLHSDPDSLTDADVELVSELYDASLRFMDDEIGRLFDGLRERGLWTDANVAFTSDHGEQFREHGDMTHCLEPYEEGAHVPLIWKLGTDELTDVSSVTSTLDIGPTLLSAAMDDPEIPEKFHGLSLDRALHGDDSDLPTGRRVFCQNTSNTDREIDMDLRITGCRTADWKFITSLDESLTTKLFHLPSDPGEQDNVAEAHPDEVEQFQAAVDEHYEQDAYTNYQIADAVSTGDVGDRLQALGYVEE
jgi:arylsulfatase A-like enzyme